MASIDKISIPKLKGTENYIIWSLRTEAALTEKGYLSAIKPDLVNIPINEEINRKSLAIIKLLCDDGPLLHIRAEKTAKAA
ncbi:hypothetical protein BD289DRAFT_439671, partial [Coniella lustricola]